MKLSLEKRHLELKVNWKLSRNQTTYKENFIVKLETAAGVFYSEIAPNIRYGETVDSILAQFQQWHSVVDWQQLEQLETLTLALDQTELHHSLRFGLESVLLSYLAAKAGQSLSQYLGLPAVMPVATSFSMPIIPVNEIKDYLAPLTRFKSLKIKVDADTAEEMLQEIQRHTQVKLRVDANEGWRDLDQFMRFQETLRGMNIELIEQPFPSHMQQEYVALKKMTPYKLLADESIEDVGDFQELARQFHAVNIKLMKTGSLIKARELLLTARQHNLAAMMGCMIETTIGISYGMLFGGMVEYVDLDGFLLIKQEPFQLVQESEGILSVV